MPWMPTTIEIFRSTFPVSSDRDDRSYVFFRPVPLVFAAQGVKINEEFYIKDISEQNLLT
jgi:hypothetical protein